MSYMSTRAGAVTVAPAPSPAGAPPSAIPPGGGATGAAPAGRGLGITPEVRQGIAEAAAALQIPPSELATIVAFETAGTMDPTKAGPTTKWGQHRGYIQFGEPQARQYGADFSSPEAAVASQLGADGAIVKFALGSGFVPGKHSAAQLYATINGGNPGAGGARDAAAGGTPGTADDKFYQQMAPFRAQASYDFESGGIDDARASRSRGITLGPGGGVDEGALQEQRLREARTSVGQSIAELFAGPGVAGAGGPGSYADSVLASGDTEAPLVEMLDPNAGIPD